MLRILKAQLRDHESIGLRQARIMTIIVVIPEVLKAQIK